VSDENNDENFFEIPIETYPDFEHYFEYFDILDKSLISDSEWEYVKGYT